MNTLLKKSSALVLAIMLSMPAIFAQSKAVQNIFDKYELDENFTRVSVSQQMFDLFIELDSENEVEQEVLDAIAKLEGLKVLFRDDQNGMPLFKESLTAVKGAGYEELMSVDDKQERVRFMIKRDGKQISELLMVMGGSNEFAIMTLFGEIDLKAISKMARVMEIRGLERLESIGKE